MSRFPFCLPNDVVFSIISYLDKNDTIECMRVCRQWYTAIPLYATDLWKSINISSTSMSKPSDCEVHCLGPHVKHAGIYKQNIYAILKALKNKNCELAGIEIDHVGQDETSQARLLSAISLFNNTLKILVITTCHSNVSPLQLLSTLPNLTHFSLTLSDLAHECLPPLHDEISCTTSNLVYFSLDYNLDFSHWIMPMLRRCPKLKVLILASNVAESSPLPDGWNQILQLCPRLNYYGWNIFNIRRNVQDITTLTAKFNDYKGIREFVFGDTVDRINKISSVLSRLYDLENLKLANRRILSDQWNSLSHIQFPRLKTMTLHNLVVRNDEWSSFCVCRPNLVSFTYEQVRVNGLDMDSMMTAVSSLKHLKHLNVSFFLSIMMNQIPNIWNNVSMLSNNTRLQKLKLTGVLFAENTFADLCRLPSLKELHVSLWPFHYNIGFRDLMVFADRMQSTGIEKLGLLHFSDLNDTALERLGQATNLSMLHVLGCHFITDTGVVAFTKEKKTMDVDDCEMVSRSGIWTHQASQ